MELLGTGAEFCLRMSQYEARGSDAAARLKADPELVDLYAIAKHRAQTLRLKAEVETSIQSAKGEIPVDALPEDVAKVTDPAQLPLFLNFRLSWELTPEILVDAVALQATLFKENVFRGQEDLKVLCNGKLGDEAPAAWHTDVAPDATLETLMAAGWVAPSS